MTRNLKSKSFGGGPVTAAVRPQIEGNTRMSKNNLKIAGFVGFGLAVILLFVAWERYSSNAKAVEAANRMMQSSPMGGMMGGMMQQMTGQSELKPSVPVATTYSLLFQVSLVLPVWLRRARNRNSRP